MRAVPQNLLAELLYLVNLQACGTRVDLTLPVLKAFQLIQVFCYRELRIARQSLVQGLPTPESILQQELLRLYTGVEAESTCNSSASVYNNIHTITKLHISEANRVVSNIVC